MITRGLKIKGVKSERNRNGSLMPEGAKGPQGTTLKMKG
jgi:hypothetical protein